MGEDNGWARFVALISWLESVTHPCMLANLESLGIFNAGFGGSYPVFIVDLCAVFGGNVGHFV
jgi:hypothetical protein